MMWKCISRGVKETFERGFRFLRPTEARIKSDTTEHTTCCQKFTPGFLETVTKYKCQENDDTKSKNHRSTAQDIENSILGAVSCSTALVLGWFITQPCLWKRWWDKRNGYVHCYRPRVPRFLTKVANLQPLAVEFHTDSTLAVNRSDDRDAVDGVQYGPKTAEEVLDEAAEEFQSVHDTIVASAENSRGVDYISAKRHREAIALFRSASQKNYAPAAYNLAQCYELGIGTKQDFVQAAKWYKVAADKGHATAMYNLGIFYAHGLGGLKACSETARTLLEKAADKGQPDAKAALAPNKKEPPSINDGLEACKDLIENDVENIMEEDPNELYKMALSYEPSVCDDVDLSQVVMHLHKMASDMGHAEAKARFQLLETYEAIGLLPEFLCGKRTDTMFLLNGMQPGVVM